MSTATISRAKVVESKGTDELKAAVKDGSVGLIKAAAVAALPKREQAAALAKPKAAPTPIRAETVSKGEYEALRDQYNELLENCDDLAAGIPSESVMDCLARAHVLVAYFGPS